VTTEKNGSSQIETELFDREALGQIVLVLQGGGALGAYQAGVYQALHETGIEPDWVIGTSIGAINASLIAGNPPKRRLERLREFWDLVRHGPIAQCAGAAPLFGSFFAQSIIASAGVRGFFEPNPLAFAGQRLPLGAERAGYYTVRPLEQTLAKLTDASLLNAGSPRLAVGAANVRTGEMTYFDSRETTLSVKHILASGALPPAFPAVRIDDELYWDGGILSNTPVEAVFDDNPRRSGLVFAVHMWAPNGPEPDSMGTVMARQKDLLYASRAKSHIARQKQIHKLRHIISELARKLPPEDRTANAARELASYGCATIMHVVRLKAPNLAGEDHAKDIDFSPGGIKFRWEAGYRDTLRVLKTRPWTKEFDPLEGFILHEAEAGQMMFEG
jgi:NTE family protein